MPKIIAFLMRHRSDVYGVATILGLILAAIAIPYSCSTTISSAPPASEITGTRISANSTTENKRYILERSAGDITKTSNTLRDHYSSEEALEELFLNRWVGGPGWTGVLLEVPEKWFDDQWRFSVWEDDSGELFSVKSANEEVSNLRKGDRIRIVEGRIMRVSRHWDGDASVTLDSVTIEVLPPISNFEQWWKQHGASLKKSFTAPWMLGVYFYWSIMLLTQVPTWISRVRKRFLKH